jgi:hypothetical protein
VWNLDELIFWSEHTLLSINNNLYQLNTDFDDKFGKIIECIRFLFTKSTSSWTLDVEFLYEYIVYVSYWL